MGRTCDPGSRDPPDGAIAAAGDGWEPSWRMESRCLDGTGPEEPGEAGPELPAQLGLPTGKIAAASKPAGH